MYYLSLRTIITVDGVELADYSEITYEVFGRACLSLPPGVLNKIHYRYR